MITREDLQVVYTDTSRPIEAYLAYEVDKLLDQLEQRIKSLEAQLSNTKQLTCDGCGFWNEYNRCKKGVIPTTNTINGETQEISHFFFCSYHEPKDTQ